MELTMLKALINEAAAMKIKPRIHFSGMGEPLIYPDIDKVLAQCSELKLSCSMTTNGLLLEKYAKELVVNNCRAINLSIHGTISEHEKITGTVGSFEKVVKGLEALSEEKKRYKKAKPTVAFNCVINNDNIPNLREILNTYAKFPVNSITFQHLVFQKKDMVRQKPHIVSDLDKLNMLIQFNDYVEQNKMPIKCSIYPRIRKEDIVGYYTDKNYSFNSTCILPWLTVRVRPNGDVQVCDQIFGNLENDSLNSIINNAKARSFRDKVRKGEFNKAVCFRCCHRQYY